MKPGIQGSGQRTPNQNDSTAILARPRVLFDSRGTLRRPKTVTAPTIPQAPKPVWKELRKGTILKRHKVKHAS